MFPKQNKINLEEKNIILAKANIAMDYGAYCSLALMNTIICSISAFILFLLLYVFIPSILTLLLLFLVPLVVAICLGTAYRYLPAYLIKKRERNIDLFLPYAVNFISSMSMAGVSPAEIFESISLIKVYGEIQKEAKKIAKEITVMAVDSITAIKHAIEISPSKKFRAFLQGIIGTIQSGSNLHEYLENIAEKYMLEDLGERKKDLDVLGVIAEVFVIAVIAFPIFLVIILTLMGFFGGSMNFSLMILLIFSFGVLPIIYAGFYVLVKSSSLEEIYKIQPMKDKNIKHYYKNNKTLLKILFSSVVLLMFFFMIIYIMIYYELLNPNIYLLFDSIFLSVFFIIGPVSLYNYIQIKKKKQIQQRLPEFLVEIGDSLSTGMTIFEAIKFAEKGHYGELSPKIKKMKSQLSWNISIKEVFNDFAFKMKSAIIQRIVITINRGMLMGGSTPKVFKAAAREVDQVNLLENQRKKDMSIYTIIILMCYFVFLGIVIILDKTIFTSFLGLQATQTAQIGQDFIMSRVNPMHLQYSLFSFVYVQSIGSGILAGFMMDGKLSSGVRYSCVLGIISFIVFKLLF
jgi:flagellar protein FlaJ